MFVDLINGDETRMSAEENNPDRFGKDQRSPAANRETPQSAATTQTHLAWLRSRMTLESTLVAWVRTAASLIAFGFAIVQFFEHYPQSTGQNLARYLGL